MIITLHRKTPVLKGLARRLLYNKFAISSPLSLGFAVFFCQMLNSTHFLLVFPAIVQKMGPNLRHPLPTIDERSQRYFPEATDAVSSSSYVQ